MRNCVILGCGRSGTSMAGGILAPSGYFIGQQPMTPSDANPKGFFEDHDIIEINEIILQRVVPARPKWFTRPWRLRKLLFHHRPLHGQRWLSVVPPSRTIPSSSEVEQRIQTLVRNEPYCFKDPRFSYTLPVWRPFLLNSVFVCVFREPAVTATSILKACQTFDYDDLNMTFSRGVRIWTAMYRHILEKHRHTGEWMFLHYSQLFDPQHLTRLAVKLEAKVDMSFPDKGLQRSTSDQPVSREAETVFRELCELAGFQPS